MFSCKCNLCESCDCNLNTTHLHQDFFFFFLSVMFFSAVQQYLSIFCPSPPLQWQGACSGGLVRSGSPVPPTLQPFQPSILQFPPHPNPIPPHPFPYSPAAFESPHSVLAISKFSGKPLHFWDGLICVCPPAVAVCFHTAVLNWLWQWAWCCHSIRGCPFHWKICKSLLNWSLSLDHPSIASHRHPAPDSPTTLGL